MKETGGLSLGEANTGGIGMTTLGLAPVIAIEYDVEIPDSCPKCGTPTEALHLIQYEPTRQKYNRNREDWDLSEHVGDGGDYLPVGWHCCECHEPLAQAQEITLRPKHEALEDAKTAALDLINGATKAG